MNYSVAPKKIQPKNSSGSRKSNVMPLKTPNQKLIGGNRSTTNRM